jgi:CRISPR/Cas system-associated exonuclease Cas4 (RecB family)
MKTTMTFLAVLFAMSSLTAQSSPDQSGSADKRQSKNPNITVQGCLGIEKGDYVLMQADLGNTYKLEGSHKIKLGPYLGEQVQVTGWERTSLSTSSDTFVSSRGVSPVTIVVESVGMLAKRCTVRDVNANHEPAAASGAQLQISSVPADADIEIDGNFVGNTPSTVAVAAGQHQLTVKKSHYKPWEKKITVTAGQINVNATLESEVK